MRVDAFDFDLPEELIALRPARPRDAARLLCVPAEGPFDDLQVRDLPELLEPGDLLILNDTAVIPARLAGRRLAREEGGPEVRVEATLIERLDGARWLALARPGRKLRVGDRLRFGGEGEACFLDMLEASVEAKGEGGAITLAFAFEGSVLDEAIRARGAMPLPPYIAAKRAPDGEDSTDYQTIYAAHAGAVAAPTAGLHFTDELLDRLASRGIERRFVTLHVGAGTFLPVKGETTEAHVMHAEWGEVSPETAEAINETRRRGGRLVAVGTTALRILESAADASGTVRPFSGKTDIFITPGYRFRAIDRLLTNFHLPRSTLFMLVSAFCGLERMQAAYAHAIEKRYRFYSYGDASLLAPATPSLRPE
ncbi:tRNA preQ1(34) S-adenosylmethionine ribosyltransferase-isomerase QueA [Afifella sp. IM 167]|uniref:tRNA preQ1(34) S-adenosylmethionine ribosyltransferase-isomerase QueA n=1 Tax=Afifella sp. IM 167 TaxID=2033586 RepID=UPI001CCE6D0E|nr:tRNA preQ1(34) S-adenosylmethionine ribosyltransferase-isomerase QueA [Afifella sp. IM 167]MBZ8132628.1 tRNA preQ1(34) S-adenosylmethionine ribosyltransferase-isomerase QueA [Afifella sp. IM 167]